ncbi:SRPBCC family protein [bacterium]|nr:SRPBCC family protein [bacterium]
MKAVKIVGAVVLGAIALILVLAALKPSHYSISREIEIQAKPQELFPQINNPQRMDAWMPWAEQDPQVKNTYSGPAEGVGAVSSWQSPGSMGHGRAEVLASVPDQRVSTRVSFEKPMVMEQLSEITLTPTAKGTIVRWTVSGENSFMGRVFCVFMNMDNHVGGMFEKGLAKLKTKAETLE